VNIFNQFSHGADANTLDMSRDFELLNCSSNLHWKKKNEKAPDFRFTKVLFHRVSRHKTGPGQPELRVPDLGLCGGELIDRDFCSSLDILCQLK
jgi:hypothetical protein